MPIAPEDPKKQRGRGRRRLVRATLSCGLFTLVIITVAAIIVVPRLIDEAPVDASDLAWVPPEIPAELNAAGALARLSKAGLPEFKEERHWLDWSDALWRGELSPFYLEHRELYEEYWSSIVPILEQVDELSRLPHFQFEISNLDADLAPHVFFLKGLEEPLLARVQLALGRGDDRQGLGHLEDWGLHCARLSHNRESLLPALITIQLVARFATQVSELVPRTSGRLEPLLEVFSQIRTDRSVVSDTLKIECQRFREVFRSPEKFDFPSKGLLSRHLFLPNKTERLYVESIRTFVREVEQTGKIETLIEVREPGGWWDSFLYGNALGRAALRISLPQYVGIAPKALVSATTVRGTELMIALVIYEEERGQLPEKLEDLVPGILPALPLDPLDQKPFRYDRDRRVVWGVGYDGVDDGGRDKPGSKDAADLVISIPKRGE